MKSLFILCSFLGTCGWLVAQEDSVLVTKNFKFQEGVYVTFADFQKNTPTYTLDQLEGKLVNNIDQYITKVETLGVKGGNVNTQLNINRIWGLCIGGIPYVRVKTGKEEGFATFAALRVRGKLCYYTYPEVKRELVEVSAYNPKNGRPFRTAKVPTEQTVKREVLLHFMTGDTTAFTLDNLMELIQEDTWLVETIEALPVAEATEKLFKCLLIYVDRNPLYIAKQN